MHLTVLSRSASVHTSRRLIEAGRAQGHRVRVIDPLEVGMGLGGEAPAIYWRRRAFPRTDAVLPRFGHATQRYGLSVLKQLELVGIPALNGAAALAASRDKMRSLQLLAAAGLPVPRTVMASDPANLREMARLVGGVPVLVKLLAADGKSGVMVCESLQSLEAALEAILGLGEDIVVQQYVRGARGRDLRVLVVGGRVAAALRRRPARGRFSRTLRRGASFEAADVPARHVEIAAEAARVFGLEVAAVDMLDLKGGPLVFEVNGTPSIREAETACGVDVAALMVARAAELARA